MKNIKIFIEKSLPFEKTAVYLHPQLRANVHCCKDQKWSLRLSVRTPGFHPGKRGSTPLGTTINKKIL